MLGPGCAVTTELEDGALSVQCPQQSYTLYITTRKIRHTWPGEEFSSTCTDYKCVRANLVLDGNDLFF